MKEIIKPYVRLSIYELAYKISETYPEGFLVKIDNEEDFLMIQYLLRSDTLDQDSELDFKYYNRNGNFHLGVFMSTLDIYEKDGSDNNSLFTDWLESDDDLKYDTDKFLTIFETISFLKSLHGVPMSKQQKQRLLDIINEI